MGIINSFDLYITILEPTKINAKSVKCYNNILTNKINDSSSQVVKKKFGDYFDIMMYLRYKGITKGDVLELDKPLIKFRPITNRKLYLFCEKVSSFDFSEIYCSNLSG